MRVTCINDSNRPNEVPLSRWVKKGEEYTIVKIDKMVQQGGIGGVKLEELNNDDLYPWSYFNINRFTFSQKQLDEAIEKGEIVMEELLEEISK